MKVFDSVPVKIPAKNVFDLSHDVKATYNFDKLYPFLCQPVYPGDTFNCRAEVFMRAMPLKCPVMHNVDMRLYFFFVPNRLIWNERKTRDWKIFITGGEDGKQNPQFPTFTYSNLEQVDPDYYKDGSLLDHMGFPSLSDVDISLQNGDVPISALPFRAYQLIWNEYFRNQNVQDEITFSYDAGPIQQNDVAKLFSFRYKCFEKDYFTSCLPWEQRGVAVTLPVGGELSLLGLADVSVEKALFAGDGTEHQLKAGSGSGTLIPVTAQTQAAPISGTNITLKGKAALGSSTVTLRGLTVGTINDFRYCLRLQQWLENNARCGSRYIEQLFAHFGVRSSDARLQRPELLGGGKVPLLFTDVEQNSFGSGSSDDVLGDLAGKGTLYGKTSGFKKYFEEHGILMGICCIVPRTSYSQGIPRAWTAFDKTDWYFPEFAHLGEQAVLNKEVYYDPSAPDGADELASDAVFGYQGRFTELRYIPSSVHGELRGDLMYWHLGRIFSNQPVLNSDFVVARSRADMFALSNVSEQGWDPFVCQMHLSIKAVRPLPKYAIPTL